MKKTILTLLAFPVLAVGLSACGGGSSQAPSSAAPQSSAAPSSAAPKTFKIGVSQLGPHPALDAATQGFVDTLQAHFGNRVDIDVQSADFDTAICNTIANNFVSKNVDLIMANATPALQAASAATASIPILGTSVTDYGVALDIEDFDGKTGINVSGTSDGVPYAPQAAMVKEVFPDAEKIGIFYCAAEANSKIQGDQMKIEFEKLGFSVEVATFSDSNEVSTVLAPFINKIDVLYIPTDNVCANAAGTINNICEPAGMPVFAAEEGLCSGCGEITLSISYYNLGVVTAEQAIAILEDGADIKNMEVAYDSNPAKKYHPARCAELEITIPGGYVPIEEE